MKKNKIFVSLLATVCAAPAFASRLDYFVNPKNKLGCGTVVSVREVNQAPLYDYEYEVLTGGRAGTRDLATLATSLNLVGAVTAAVASLAIDAVRDESVRQPGVKPPSDGRWRNINAVRVEMDDGRVMNLPLTGKPKFSLSTKYKPGVRTVVYWVPEFKSIQLDLETNPEKPGEKLYAIRYTPRVEEALANEVIKGAENLVDETLIVQ